MLQRAVRTSASFPSSLSARKNCGVTLKGDLDADAQQDECGQAKQNVDAGWAKLSQDALGLAVADVYGERNDRQAYQRADSVEQQRTSHVAEQTASQGYHDGNRSGTHRKRQRQWIKCA